MFKLFSLLIAILFINSSCKPIIEINGNSYRLLSEKSKSKLMKFNPSYCSNCLDTLNYGHFMEVGGDDLKSFIGSNKMVVIKFLNIYCSSSSFTEYVRLNEYFNENNSVKYLLISKEYNLKQMRMFKDSLEMSGNLFILKDEYYGHKLKRINRKFHKELKETSKSGYSTTNQSDNTFVFKEGKLIFNGEGIPIATIDSIGY